MTNALQIAEAAAASLVHLNSRLSTWLLRSPKKIGLLEFEIELRQIINSEEKTNFDPNYFQTNIWNILLNQGFDLV